MHRSLRLVSNSATTVLSGRVASWPWSLLLLGITENPTGELWRLVHIWWITCFYLWDLGKGDKALFGQNTVVFNLASCLQDRYFRDFLDEGSLTRCHGVPSCTISDLLLHWNLALTLIQHILDSLRACIIFFNRWCLQLRRLQELLCLVFQFLILIH